MAVASTGRCQHMLAMQMSKEECCRSGSASQGWTPHDDVTSGKLFYWRALAGGAPECSPCQGEQPTNIISVLGTIFSFLPGGSQIW